jgi:hypothetical protein
MAEADRARGTPGREEVGDNRIRLYKTQWLLLSGKQSHGRVSGSEVM